MPDITRVKICGITNLKDALSAVSAGAWALGFVFAESPRRVTPETAKKIISRLPPFVTAVGVFLNHKEDAVEQITDYCRLTALQFHGDESPDYCDRFHGIATIIKAFRIRSARDLKKLKYYKVDAFLLDTWVKGKPGGTGRTFNWELAKEAKEFKKPVILSGGLNKDNVKPAILQARPYAVDTSSGVEISPGRKSPVLVRNFINKVKEADEVLAKTI